MKIDVDTVIKLIKEQFPEFSDLEVTPIVPGGWDNRSFCLGDDKLIRMPSHADYVEQVSKEQHWLPLLAKVLKTKIPRPVAKGCPSKQYPFNWSIYEWLPGITLSEALDANKISIAKDLANFLLELQSVDSSDAPEPGKHNFYRGGLLEAYDAQARDAIKLLKGKYAGKRMLGIWEDALATKWEKDPVWVHGDLSADNILLHDGKLSAVIDFGCMAVGDPACDYAIAWTYFDAHSRDVFENYSGVDAATWLRGKAWAMWKAAIVVAGIVNGGDVARETETLNAIL